MVRAAACLLCLACALPARGAPLEVVVTDAAGRPLAGAAVFLESREARAAVRPATGVEIEQQDKRFVQRVTVVPVGTPVAFPNRDTVRHHVYSFSPAKPFELKLYIGTPAHPVLFDKPGIAVLGCNIHDTMVAWVVVVETPWYGLTDAQGRLKLDAPPGSYRLRTWHPGLAPGAPALDQALALAAAGGQAGVKLPVEP